MNITNKRKEITMESITLREYKHLSLGYDLIGKEYYVWDKLNNKWFWFKYRDDANLSFENERDFIK